MKKSLIAVAVAGVFAAPVAMADGMAINGVIDIGVASQKGAGTFLEHGALTDHDAINFQWTEDLSTGLKAIVNLEAGFGQNGDAADGGRTGGGANAHGTNVLFSRETYVGLSGDFGTVRMGQILSPQVIAAASNTLGVGQFFVERLLIGGRGAAALSGNVGVQAGNGGFFIPNAIAYSTPDMQGWKASVLGSLKAGANDGAVLGNTVNDKYLAAHIGGPIGPVTLNVGYSKRDGNIVNPGYTSLSLGGTMNLSDELSIAAGAFRNKDADATATIMSYNVGVAYKLPTSTTLSAQYGRSNLDRTTSPSSGFFTSSKDPSIWALAAVHDLSKMTKVYLIVSGATHGASATLGNRGNTALPLDNGSSQADNNQALTVGLAKTF